MRLSELSHCRIVDEDGEPLGRIRHVSAAPRGRNPEDGLAELVVTKLHYGKGVFLERLGVRRLRSRSIDWSEVLRVEPGKVVVRRSRTEEAVRGE